MQETYEVIQRLTESIDDINLTLQSQRCLENPAHSTDSYTGFICIHPTCTKRIICSRCILEDNTHNKMHRNYFKTIKEFTDISRERCRDNFVNEIEIMSKEVNNKYVKKVNKCASSCTEIIEDTLKTLFPVQIETVVEVFEENIMSPINTIADGTRKAISELGNSYLNSTKGNPSFRDHTSVKLEKIIKLIKEKEQEEDNLWNTAGKILQRQKHKIIYNKELEKNLNRDIENLTKTFIQDVCETYKSYFFTDEKINSISVIHKKMSSCSPMVMQDSEFNQILDQMNFNYSGKLDVKITSSSKTVRTENLSHSKHITPTEQILLSEFSLPQIASDPNLPNRELKKSKDYDKTRLSAEDNCPEKEEEQQQLSESVVIQSVVINNKQTFERGIKVETGIDCLIKESEFAQTHQKHAFSYWLPNDESKFSKLFKEDFRFFCIADLVEGEELNNLTQFFYKKYYPGLFYVFLNYQSTSMKYPGLSWMEMNALIRKCTIFDSIFTESVCDEIYQDVLQTVNSVLKRESNEFETMLLRGGFISYLTRVALVRFYREKEMSSIKAIEKFMGIFFKTAEHCRDEYEVKRIKQIHTKEVNLMVNFFQEQTSAVYEEFHQLDGYLYLEDLVEWIDTTELIINENELQRCFSLSKMPIIDEFNIGGKNYLNLEKVEFLEFLVRISELDFYHDQHLELHLKVKQTFQKLFTIF